MRKHCDTKDKLLQVGFDLIWDSSYGSVSVDDICSRAGINKGSFYHFFPSKADLAVAALEEHWKEKRPMLDRIFSPQVPPLERLQLFCREIVRTQTEKAEKYGHVCGCPYSSVGSEMATMDEKIRRRSEQLMNSGKIYIETAISDAIRTGAVGVTNASEATDHIYAVMLGMMLEARVQNDLKVLDGLESTVMGVLGARALAA